MPDELDLAAQYRALVRQKAIAYAATDRRGYDAILREVLAGYRGGAGEYKKCMLEVQRRCASASGLLPFAEWSSSLSTKQLAAGGG